jgi:hypothetical protein
MHRALIAIAALALGLAVASAAGAGPGQRGVPTGKFASSGTHHCAHGKLCGHTCIPRNRACRKPKPQFGGSHGDDTPTESSRAGPHAQY